MKQIFSFFILFIFSINLFGQKNNPQLKPPPPPNKQEEKNHNCFHKNKFSFSSRVKKYPFIETSQVQFVSFTDMRLSELIDTIVYSKFTEVKILTLKQIDALTDILYNVGYSGPIAIEEDDNYYMPKNAILFLDARGKIFAFIELDLDSQAQGYKLSSTSFSIGDLCIQKISMLKKLFKEVGVTYGTAELN
jgi:hypothetical protein